MTKRQFVGIMLGFLVLAVPLSSQTSALTAPASPTPLFVVDFKQDQRSASFGDLGTFATKLIELRLRELPSIRVIREASEPTCTAGQGALDFFTVRGALEARDDEVVLTYELLKTSNCEIERLLLQSVSLNERDAFQTLAAAADVLASSVEDESEKLIVGLLPTKAPRHEKELAEEVVAYLFLKLGASGGLQPLDLPEPSGQAVDYKIESRLALAKGKLEAHLYIHATQGGSYKLPVVPGDPADRLSFLDAVAEAAISGLLRIRSGLQGDLSGLQTDALMDRARELLCLQVTEGGEEGACSPNPETAVAVLEDVTRRDPNHLAAFELLGQALSSARSFNKAAVAFERALELARDQNPKAIELLRSAADARYEARHYDKAAEHYSLLIQRLEEESRREGQPWGKDATLPLRHALSLRLANDRLGAVGAILKGLSLVQEGEGAALLRRDLNSLIGELDRTRLESAVEAIRGDLSLTSPDPLIWAMTRLGQITLATARDQKDFEYIREQFEGAFALGPSEPWLRTELLDSLMEFYRYVGDREAAGSLIHLLMLEFVFGAPEEGPMPGDADWNAAHRANSIGAFALDSGDLVNAQFYLDLALKLMDSAPQPDASLKAKVISNIGHLNLLRGQFDVAQEMLRQSLALHESTFAPNHPEVASVLDSLGEVAYERGSYLDAEDLLQRALQMKVEVLGLDHPASAISLRNLGKLYFTQGRYADAGELYRQALALEEKAFGPAHPRIAETLQEIGEHRAALARYQDAHASLERALKIWEDIFGPGYHKIAGGLITLADLLMKEGRYAEARAALERALSIAREIDEEHGLVATSVGALGAVEYRLGKYDAAEQQYRRALAIFEKVLGPSHLKVAQSLTRLGTALTAVGRYAEAEAVFDRALRIEEAMGEDHLSLANLLNNLGILYREQERFEEAERVYLRALHLKEKMFGTENPELVTSLLNLGQLYLSPLVARSAEAKPVTERALAIAEKSLGDQHPLVAAILNNLGLIYWRGDKDEQHAEEAFLRALAIENANLGPASLNAASTLMNLGNLHSSRQDYVAAEELLGKSLAIRVSVLGPDHFEVAQTLSFLGGLHTLQSKVQAAEESYRRALTIVEGRSSPRERRLASYCLDKYASLLSSTGREDEAARLKERSSKANLSETSPPD